MSSTPDWSMCCLRNRMNRMGVPIQVNDGIMGGLAVIASTPIATKQELKHVL